MPRHLVAPTDSKRRAYTAKLYMQRAGRLTTARCLAGICPLRVHNTRRRIVQLDGVEGHWLMWVLVARADAVLLEGGYSPVVLPRTDLSLQLRSLAVELCDNLPGRIIGADHGTVHPVALLGRADGWASGGDVRRTACP